MQGRFDIYLQDARGLTDEDFIQARREGRLKSLLKGLPVDEEVHCDNQVMHMYPIAIWREAMNHGFPSGAYPMERGAGIPFYSICILSDTSEPAYTDWFSGYWDLNNMSYNVGNSPGKRFVAHDEELLVDVGADSRESVFLRERWLYLPSQVVSNQIRSVGVYWCENITDGSDERGMVARVRMKNAGGQPITLNKSSSQTLLIQYTFTLVAL